MEAIQLAEREGDLYLTAVSKANLAILGVHFERYEEATVDLAQVRKETLGPDGTNALFSVSVANAWLLRAFYGGGDFVRARETWEEWLRFAEINSVLSQDADGQGMYGLLFARLGDRGASQWLVQAIDTAISSRRRAALESVAQHILGAMPNLGLELFAAEGAKVIRNWVSLEGRYPSHFFDRLLVTSSGEGSSGGRTSRMGDRYLGFGQAAVLGD